MSRLPSVVLALSLARANSTLPIARTARRCVGWKTVRSALSLRLGNRDDGPMDGADVPRGAALPVANSLSGNGSGSTVRRVLASASPRILPPHNASTMATARPMRDTSPDDPNAEQRPSARVLDAGTYVFAAKSVILKTRSRAAWRAFVASRPDDLRSSPIVKAWSR